MRFETVVITTVELRYNEPGYIAYSVTKYCDVRFRVIRYRIIGWYWI